MRGPAAGSATRPATGRSPRGSGGRRCAGSSPPAAPARGRRSPRCSSAQARAAAVDSPSGDGTWRSMYCAWPPSRQGGTTQCRATAVGDLAAVVAAEQVQAQVDAGAQAGAGQHVAVVGEQHAGVDAGRRGAGPPAASAYSQWVVAGAAVEQPGRREHEGAGADRDQPGAAAVPSPAPRRRRRGGSRRCAGPGIWVPGTITVSAVARADASCCGRDRVARRRADRSAVEARHRHVVQRPPAGVLGLAEELGGDHGVVPDQRLEQQDDDAVRTVSGHGRILAHYGNSATGDGPDAFGRWGHGRSGTRRPAADLERRRPAAGLHWAWVVAAVTFVTLVGSAAFRSRAGRADGPAAHGVRLVARARSASRCR